MMFLCGDRLHESLFYLDRLSFKMSNLPWQGVTLWLR